jgi:serine/threonine protein kinase
VVAHLRVPQRIGSADVLGTAMYMSPEQLKAAREVDLRTDIWSLGVILYQLIAGVPPFPGSSIASVARAVEKNAPKPLSELRPDIPEELEAVIARCMKTNPAYREHRILVEADGFTSQSTTVKFADDLHIAMSLTTVPAKR